MGGAPEGILLMWDVRLFKAMEVLKGVFSISVVVEFQDLKGGVGLKVCMGLLPLKGGRRFGRRLVISGSLWRKLLFSGRLNLTRFSFEKFGGGRIAKSMKCFNRLIEKCDLVDPLGEQQVYLVYGRESELTDLLGLIEEKEWCIAG